MSLPKGNGPFCRESLPYPKPTITLREIKSLFQHHATRDNHGLDTAGWGYGKLDVPAVTLMLGNTR
jgi:hypothetical protein